METLIQRRGSDDEARDRLSAHQVVVQVIHGVLTAPNGVSVTLDTDTLRKLRDALRPEAHNPWESGWDEWVARGTLALAVVTVLAIVAPIVVDLIKSHVEKIEQRRKAIEVTMGNLGYALFHIIKTIKTLKGFETPTVPTEMTLAISIHRIIATESSAIVTDLQDLLNMKLVYKNLSFDEYSSILTLQKGIRVAGIELDKLTDAIEGKSSYVRAKQRITEQYNNFIVQLEEIKNHFNNDVVNDYYDKLKKTIAQKDEIPEGHG